MIEKQLKPGETEPDENAPLEINHKLCPESVIMLGASEKYIKELMGSFTERQVLRTHNNYKDFERRMKIWRVNNLSEDYRDVFKDFFVQWNIDYIEIELERKKLDQFKSLRIFVERNGKYINYQEAEMNEEKKRMAQEEEEKQRKQELKLEQEKKKAEQETERLKVQEEEVRLKMIKLRTDDKHNLDEKSEYLRYLLLM